MTTTATTTTVTRETNTDADTDNAALVANLGRAKRQHTHTHTHTTPRSVMYLFKEIRGVRVIGVVVCHSSNGSTPHECVRRLLISLDWGQGLKFS